MIKKLLYGLAVGALVGLSVVGVLLGPPVGAQEAQPTLPAPPSEEAEKPTAALKPAASERELAVKITPQMVRYSHTRYALYFAASLLQALALVFILQSGLSAKLRDLAERKARAPFWQACLYFPLLMGVYSLLLLPLTFYSSFLLSHQYGLSNQNLGGWAADYLKSSAISIGVGAPVVALLYWTLRKKPRTWWFTFWLASIPLIVLSVLVVPLVVDPLYNRFEPLREGPLRDRILGLAQQAGIERSRVFEVDASKRTKAVNAYVTGLGGSARIVLWDTLLQKLDEDEIAFIMAHEMGHYVERHVPIGMTLSIFGSLFVFWAGDRAARLLIRRRGEAWRIRDLDDLASLPVLLLLLLLVNFFGSPVESAISRTIESRADSFGLRLTGDGRAAASSFIKLSEMNLSHPSPPPFIELWMFSHPPLQKRIDRALAAHTERGDAARANTKARNDENTKSGPAF